MVDCEINNDYFVLISQSTHITSEDPMTTETNGFKGELYELIRRLCLRHGHAPGKPTVPVRLTAFTTALEQRGAFLITMMFLEWFHAMKNEKGWSVEMIGGDTSDTLGFATAIMALAERRGHSFSVFGIRPQTLDHGLKTRLIGDDVSGRQVILLQDTLGDGEALTNRLELLRAAGATVVAVFSIIDLEEGGLTAMPTDLPHGCLFTATELQRG
ncbi:MAG: hypothetical protein EXS55_01855 [Candidatus Magasanikbacteria bacterium]|nr:hypothetical protein [Candidatus Magasanikbacteria bacterium]